MQTILAVWKWFDGKKTAFGAALQLFADITPFVLAALPDLGVPLATAAAITAKGAIVLGLAHKILKWLGSR